MVNVSEKHVTLSKVFGILFGITRQNVGMPLILRYFDKEDLMTLDIRHITITISVNLVLLVIRFTTFTFFTHFWHRRGMI